MENSTIHTPKKTNNGSLTDDEIKEALFKTGGHQANAAKLLGYTRAYICQRVNASDYLKEAYNDIKETNLDDAEEGLGDLIKRREFPAICFFLKTIGRSRGYIESRGDEGSINIEAIKAFGDMFSKIQLKPADDPGPPKS